MSTRAIIARPHPTDPTRWTGTYVHSDGYPTVSGQAVWNQVVDRFGKDPEKAAQYLIDQHPTGWSYVTDEEAVCYCHDRGEGTDTPAVLTEKDAGGIDYTYVLRPEGLEVHRWGRGVVAVVPWDQQSVDWGVIQRAADNM